VWVYNGEKIVAMYCTVYKVQPFDCVFILQTHYITYRMFKQYGI